ncbi:MAG: hypothetical protein JW995_09145 [Melioribacteraceae bacterium]|nr:hypothetical protein [Melioribacteraceae bacterium]
MTEHLVRCKLIVFFFVHLTVNAQQIPVEYIDSLMIRGTGLIITQQYDSAFSIFKSIDEKYEDNPIGKIYLAGTLITQAFEEGTEFKTEIIDSLLNDAIYESEILLDTDDENIWNLYYAGLAKGFKAYYKALNENFIDAFIEGFTALSLFSQCLEINNNFAEAQVAVGTYLYWRSEKSEFLSWLPFVRDDMDKSIKMLADAFHRARYNNLIAAYSLFWIYISKEDYKSASGVCEKILELYPASRLFRHIYAKSLKLYKVDSAVNHLIKLRDEYEKAGLRNRKIQIMLELAELYFTNKNYKSAIENCDGILNLTINDKTQQDRFRKAGDLKNKALRFISNN